MASSENKQQRNRKGFGWLIGAAAVLVLATIGLAIAFALNSANTMTTVAAQDDTAEIEAQESNEPTVTNPSTQVINLVSLMGLDSQRAVFSIGHGAAVQEGSSLTDLGFSQNELTVLLTDEKGDSLSGTPTVTLGLTDGNVTAAAYSAATSQLGYGDLSFTDAVEKFHIVENTLGKCGLSVQQGSVTLPERSTYSTYGPDLKTLELEECTFQGTGTVGATSYAWEATLTYDYTMANEQSNLAYTSKRLTVSIMQQ